MIVCDKADSLLLDIDCAKIEDVEMDECVEPIAREESEMVVESDTCKFY